MAVAIIGGLLEARLVTREQLRVVEINADSRTKLQNEFGVQASADLAVGVAGSNVVVLAVKPQQLREVALQLKPLLTGQLLLSIAAGIRASDLVRWLGTRNIVRAMPNTPALVRRGITGLFALPEVSAGLKQAVGQIMDAVGKSVWLDDEAQLDAVTAISGSGPAYVFYFIESMLQAAQELGLTETQARALVYETFSGAVELANQSNETPATLRARVTSKNGTTERALLSVEANQVKQHIIEAAKAAATRAQEMGDEFGKDD